MAEVVAMPDRLKEHFDAKYAATRPPRELPLRPKYARDRVSACRVALPRLLPPEADVLELGAGDGSLICEFDADGVRFGRYVATEIAAARLAALESIATEYANVEARAVNAESIDGSLGRFDAIVMIGVVPVQVDPMGALDRIRRMLRPGGLVWIQVPNVAKLTRRIKLAAGRFPSTSSRNEGLTTYDGHPADLYDEDSLHYFTYRSLELMLVDRCGFARVERFPYPGRRRLFGDAVDAWLTRRMPTLLADICVAAYVN